MAQCTNFQCDVKRLWIRQIVVTEQQVLGLQVSVNNSSLTQCLQRRSCKSPAVHYVIVTKTKSKVVLHKPQQPIGRHWSPFWYFWARHPLWRETMDTRLVNRTVCLFMSQLLPLPNYCLVTDAHRCEQCHGWGWNSQPLSHKSNALTTTLLSHPITEAKTTHSTFTWQHTQAHLHQLNGYYLDEAGLVLCLLILGDDWCQISVRTDALHDTTQNNYSLDPIHSSPTSWLMKHSRSKTSIWHDNNQPYSEY